MAQRTFISEFPDYIGLVTARGRRFAFKNHVITTDDQEIIAILEDRKNNMRDVREVSEEEAKKLAHADTVAPAAEGIVMDTSKIDASAGTTITPQDLQNRMAAIVEAQKVAATPSSQLENTAVQSDSKPVAAAKSSK